MREFPKLIARIGARACWTTCLLALALAAPAMAAEDVVFEGVTHARLFGDPSLGAKAPDLLWEKKFDPSSIMVFSAVALADRGFVLAGSKAGDGWMARLDDTGTIVWESSFGGDLDDVALAAIALADGGFAVAGWRSSVEGGKEQRDVYVVRLDASGEVLWQGTYGGVEDDFAFALAAHPGGGFVIGGANGSANGVERAWILRLDENGKSLWERLLGGDKAQRVNGITVLPDGGITAAGVLHTSRTQYPWAARLNADGNVLWEHTFSYAANMRLSSIAQLEDGEFAIAGMSYATAERPSRNDAWVMRLDADGKVIWERTFGGDGDDEASSVTAMPDGGLVFAGAWDFMDALVVRLDREGKVLWERRFEARPSHNVVTSMAVSAYGDITVVGHVLEGNDSSVWTARLKGAPGTEGRPLRLDRVAEKKRDRKTDADAAQAPARLEKQLEKRQSDVVTEARVSEDPSPGAKAPGVPWEKTFGGPGLDLAEAMAALPDGGIVFAGRSKPEKSEKWKGWLVRLDSGGSVVWERRYENDHNEDFYAVAVFPDGGLVVAGSRRLLRLDSEGEILWQRAGGSDVFSALRAVAILPDGGVTVAGSVWKKGEGRSALILRFDADGALLWRTTFLGNEGSVSAIALLPNGDVAVAGKTLPREKEDWVIRLDADGAILWERYLPETDSGADFNADIWALAARGGDIAVAGTISLDDDTHLNAWITVLDPGGEVRWEKILDAGGSETARSLVALPDGGLAFVGEAGDAGWLARLDAEGNMLWERIFKADELVRPMSVELSATGDFLVAGKFRGKGTDDWDGWAARVKPKAVTVASPTGGGPKERQAGLVTNVRRSETPARRPKASESEAGAEEGQRKLEQIAESAKPADVLAEIVAPGARLLELPEPGSTILGVLPLGAKVHVTGVLPSGWVRIESADQPVGYTYKTVISPQARADLGFVQSAEGIAGATATGSDELAQQIADLLVEFSERLQHLAELALRADPAAERYGALIGVEDYRIGSEEREMIRLVSRYRPDREDILRSLGNYIGKSIDKTIKRFVLPRFWEIAVGKVSLEPDQPYLGYFYQSVATDFEYIVALCARPEKYTSGYRQTFIFSVRKGSEEVSLLGSFTRDLGGECVTAWPAAPEEEGWQRIVIEPPGANR